MININPPQCEGLIEMLSSDDKQTVELALCMLQNRNILNEQSEECYKNICEKTAYNLFIKYTNLSKSITPVYVIKVNGVIIYPRGHGRTWFWITKQSAIMNARRFIEKVILDQIDYNLWKKYYAIYDGVRITSKVVLDLLIENKIISIEKVNI